MIIQVPRIIILACLLATFVVSPFQVSAQEDEASPIQEVTGLFEEGYTQFYLLKDLKQGETLYVYMEGLSGNLDPFVGLSDLDTDPVESLNSFNDEIDTIIDQGIDPLAILPEIGPSPD